MDFLKGAKEFARNPLGIIALFISLIYGFASLLLNSAAEKLTAAERWPLIIFIVIFPIMVLVSFYWLVKSHHGKLYAPGDFKDDKSFLRTLSPEEQEKKLDKEVKESLVEDDKEVEIKCESVSSSQSSAVKGRDSKIEEHRRFREELSTIESAVIQMISSEFKVNASPNIGIDGTDAQFDAMLHTVEPFTFLEIKVLRSSFPSSMILDRVLYHAVIADKFFESKFKLIIVVVYYFEDSQLDRVERMWR